MDLEWNNEGEGIVLSTKNSTRSMEEENFCFPSTLKLKTFESFFEQPKLFKEFSEVNQELKNDPFFDLFKEEPFKKIRVEEDNFDWSNHDLSDVFSLPCGQREDILCESRLFGFT
jgi:hypothetical protein